MLRLLRDDENMNLEWIFSQGWSESMEAGRHLGISVLPFLLYTTLPDFLSNSGQISTLFDLFILRRKCNFSYHVWPIKN